MADVLDTVRAFPTAYKFAILGLMVSLGEKEFSCNSEVGIMLDSNRSTAGQWLDSRK